MFLQRSRRPLIIVATLLQLLNHKSTWNPFSTPNSADTQPQEIIEECCDQAITITHTVRQTATQTVTQTATDSQRTSPTELPFLEELPINTDVCDVFDFSAYSNLYEVIDYLWWIAGLWPLLMYFPRRKKERQLQKEQVEKHNYINDLEERVATLNRTVEEMSTIKLESSLAIGTLSTLAERRQLEILHEKEKVNLFIKQHLEFSGVRKDLRFAMEKLQEENNDLRAQMRDLSSRYQRVITDLPNLLLPPPIIAKSISSDEQPMISVVSKTHNAMQKSLMDHCNE